MIFAPKTYYEVSICPPTNVKGWKFKVPLLKISMIKFSKLLRYYQATSSYHEEKKTCFYKGFFGQNKGFKGNFSKNKVEANVHPCNSFGGQKSSHAIFHGRANVRRAFVRTPTALNGFDFEGKNLWRLAERLDMSGLSWRSSSDGQIAN